MLPSVRTSDNCHAVTLSRECEAQLNNMRSNPTGNRQIVRTNMANMHNRARYRTSHSEAIGISQKSLNLFTGAVK